VRVFTFALRMAQCSILPGVPPEADQPSRRRGGGQFDREQRLLKANIE